MDCIQYDRFLILRKDACEGSCAVGEAFFIAAECLEHGEVEVGERCVF